MSATEKPLKVFVSYSHDSPEHRDRVLALADRLRTDGIDAVLDQYETSPPEGWPRWMDRQIDEAQFVLLVCTETYFRRVMGREAPERGHGVIWESNLIYQLIYDAGSAHAKFIPVLFAGASLKDVPRPLRGATAYSLDRDDGYLLLYRRLTAQPDTDKPPIGTIRRLDERVRQWTERPGPDVTAAPRVTGRGASGMQPLPDSSPPSGASPPSIASPRGPVLNRRHTQQRPPETGLDLLNPFNRAIALIGRDREMANLTSWLHSERPILARCLIGPAGSGKTRIALELCASAEAEGWTAGFIEASELVRFIASPGHADVWWDTPTLAVLDQAASISRALRPWLITLIAGTVSSAPRLRLLILERHADPHHGWWPDLGMARDWSEEGILRLFDPPEPCPLPSLLDSEQRRALLAAAMNAAAALKKLPRPIRPPDPGVDVRFDRELGEAENGCEPLHLIMAGINSVDRGHATLQFNRMELVDRIAAHEIGRIESLAQCRDLDPPFLVHMAAFLTLVRGCPRDLLPRLIEGERTAMGWLAHDSVPEIERALSDALFYDEDAEDIAPILPELIGEAALIQILACSTAEVQAEIVRRGYWIYAEDAVGMVLRTAQDFAAGDATLPLAWLDTLIAEADEPDEMLALAAQFPDRSVALRGKAVIIQEGAVAALTSRWQGDPNAAHSPLLADAQVRLSGRYRDVGRFDDALAAAQQAVDLYRKLQGEGAKTYRTEFAAALTTLAGRLSDLGRRQEALDVATEAVDLLRDVLADPAAAADGRDSAGLAPPAVRRALGQALIEQADHFCALGMHREALSGAEEAVECFFNLDVEDSHPHHPRLAVALAHLAQHHAHLEHRRQALIAAQQSVQMLTELVTDHADAYRPDLARSQRRLALCLSACGKQEEALAAARKAVDLQRSVVLACPEACSVDLAIALHTLSRLLFASGPDERIRDALSAETESIDLLRSLAPTCQAVVEPHLARSLNHLGTLRLAAGDKDAAVAAVREAVTMEEKLVEARPERFRPDLARSQQSAAGVLFNAGKFDEAFLLGNQAVSIRRDLACSIPDAFTPELAASLRLLAEGHLLRGRETEAHAAIREALAIYERLARTLPREQVQEIIDSLSALARTAQSRGFRAVASTVQAGLATVRRRASNGTGIARPIPPSPSPGTPPSPRTKIESVLTVVTAMPPGSPPSPTSETRLALDVTVALTAFLRGSPLPTGIDAGCCQTLLSVLTSRLLGDDQQEAFRDFRQAPAEADNQAHLRKTLRNALRTDGSLRETLSMLLGTASGVG